MKRLFVFLTVVLAACSGTTGESTDQPVESGAAEPRPTTADSLQPGSNSALHPPPTAPDGPLDPSAREGLDNLLLSIEDGGFDAGQLRKVADAGDARIGWFLADLLRVFQTGPPRNELVFTFASLTGIPYLPSGRADFVNVTNMMIDWDLPDYPGYLEMKARLFTLVDDRWDVFFDEDGTVDWRHVSWGGVLADDRPFDENGPCNCIPALDNPATTPASEGDWHPDERIVFGLVVDGEALALPKHQMEVHEMLNLTLGGRDLGVPYCTLCGSAQAYFTDNVAGLDRAVLRTSGLLIRSNKMMYELNTQSLVDTFTGEATTGELAERGVRLEQTTVVASTWGDWKKAHPNTRILAPDGGIGRSYRFDPLGDRDADGPIFPVGSVDERLGVQEEIVGVITADGQAIAFPKTLTIEDASVSDVVFEGVTVTFSDGLRVFDQSGAELPTHQAFWFAWSQFHPETLVYPGSG